LNASFVLHTGSGATVFDDNVTDSLTGGAGRDWFFWKSVNPNKDKILDNLTGEEQTLL
jgi:Ca2+-binding RTX toxin-like protein